jgi:Spy/CpxP family protein refolding chaperone
MCRLGILAVLWTVVFSCVAARAGVVINEIFYHAPDDIENLEYIELYNAGDQPVDLGGWKFTKGPRYQFPANTKIEADGYLVICRNQDRFKDAYGFAANGTFDQPLSNQGERIELSDARGKMVDSVKYSDKPPWPIGPDGYSASLERISPLADGALPQNWAGSPLSEDGVKPAGTPGKPNANFSANLPPIISGVKFTPANPAPGEEVRIEADVRDTDGVGEVTLRYRVVSSASESAEASVPMARTSDQHFAVAIPGQKASQIIRFRIQAKDQPGSVRLYPAPNEPRPALSCLVQSKFEPGKIPFGLVINVGEEEFKAAEQRRKNPNRGGFSEENQMRFMARVTLESGMDLASAWLELTLNHQADFGTVQKLRPVFTVKLSDRDKLIQKTAEDPHLQEKMKEVPDLVKSFHTGLSDALKAHLDEEQQKKFSEWQQQKISAAAAPPQWGPEMMLKQMVNLEAAYFVLSSRADLTEAQLERLRSIYRSSLQTRGELGNMAKAIMQQQGDWGDLQEKIAALGADIEKQLKPVLTPEQDRAFGQWRKQNNFFTTARGGSSPSPKPQGSSAFIYVNPDTRQTELFDFVHVIERSGGYKVHFHKDRPLRRMTTINLIFEYNDRFVLAEPLAYEVYRRAGNAAELTDFVRLWIDGEPLGYHLLIEQPNKAFLRRNKLKDEGNLYKILWYERGVVGQHEKKTNRHTGHEDVVELVELLEKTRGDEQWAVIKKHFNVEQVINYFAVNTCLSHWDGFFNNYFTYHDLSGSGKWEMYPWDQDKTWGFHDGIQGDQVFYDMPITFGMAGDAPPGWPKDRPPPQGFGGGAAWWRPGGWFSKPLLANPHFRKHFLARTREILETIYTSEVFFPIIDATGDRLKEEVRIRAAAMKEDPDKASERFQKNLSSLKDHLTKRRQFLIEQAEIRAAGKFDRTALK